MVFVWDGLVVVLDAFVVGEWAVLLKVFISSNIHMGGTEWSQKD